MTHNQKPDDIYPETVTITVQRRLTPAFYEAARNNIKKATVASKTPEALARHRAAQQARRQREKEAKAALPIEPRQPKRRGRPPKPKGEDHASTHSHPLETPPV